MRRRRHASKLIAYSAVVLLTLTAVATAVTTASAHDATAKPAAKARVSGAHGTSVQLGQQSIPSASMGALALSAPIVAMASTPGQKQDFNFSCITLVVTVIAYLIVRRVRQPRAVVEPAA